MDLSQYRQQVAADIEAAEQQQTSFRDLLHESEGGAAPAVTGPPADDAAAASEVVLDKNRDSRLRLAAIQVISDELGQHPDLLNPVLALFRDPSEPRDLRLAALRVVQQASFQLASFAGNRADYLETLRSVVNDADAEARRRAIGILAREKDDYVQRRLVQGLQDPSKALVVPAKAIQYLGYDVHAEYFPLLRQIVANPPDLASRKEAVRLLSADPSSKDLLTRLLNDKNEHSDVRHMSALALQSIAPDAFRQVARGFVLDDSEDDRLRSTFVSALAHFADADTLRKDVELTNRVQQLGDRSESADLKQASAKFVDRIAAPPRQQEQP